MESTNSKKAVFIQRAEGMSFEEFKKACIKRFREAGLLQDKPKAQPSPELPDELDLQAHDLSEQGLTELRDKLVLNPESTTVNKKEPA
jgi:hypothetical protein